jgi:hypothetical protein
MQSIEFFSSQSFVTVVSLEEEEEYSCLSVTLWYMMQSTDSFDKLDIFLTTIAGCSSGQKVGLTQSFSA